MSELPVTAAPQTETAGPTASTRQLRIAGIAVVAAALTGMGLIVWILSVRAFEPMFLYALCPWLFLLMFVRSAYAMLVIPLIFGVSVATLGVLVVRGSRDALIAAVTMLVVEAVPSGLIAVASGAGFAFPAVPRVALIVYLATVLRTTRPLGASAAPVATPATASTGSSPTGPSVIRVILGGALAVVGGLSVGLAYRAVGSLDEFAYSIDLYDWWLPMSWPAAVLGFVIGWFATSTKSAVLLASTALALVVLVPMTELHSTAGQLTTVVTSALFGVMMGWLGHVARGRTLPCVLAALYLPAFMALEMVRRPGGFLPSVGSWSVLRAAALLAVAFSVRAVIVRRRPRNPGPPAAQDDVHPLA